MKQHTIIQVVLLVFLVVLSGCHTLKYGGAPKPIFSKKDMELFSEKVSSTERIEKFFEERSKSGRNKFIVELLSMINIRYSQFINKTASEKQFFDSATEMTEIGLSLAATATGSKGAKTTLAAIMAGVSGSKETIDKNYYYEKTIPALVMAMNAERKKRLVTILEGMHKSIEEYLPAQAVADLWEYYYAGTFLGGILAIQKDAGLKEEDEDKNIKIAKLVPMKYSAIELKRSLTYTIEQLSAADLEKAKAILEMLDKDADPKNFVDVKQQLQSHVRLARTNYGVNKIAKIFENEGIKIKEAQKVSPIGAITSPKNDITIKIGEPVTFLGEKSAGQEPFTYLWNFGDNSGIPDSTERNPGEKQFENTGTFKVTFLVTDANGIYEKTPDKRVIIVNSSQ